MGGGGGRGAAAGYSLFVGVLISVMMTSVFANRLACIASVSARVRRESCTRSNFRAITRLETLATQAINRYMLRFVTSLRSGL